MSSQDAGATTPLITFFDPAGIAARPAEPAQTSRPFTGAARYTDGSTSKLAVQMTTEGRTGEIAGTILLDGTGKNQASHLYLFRGQSRRRMFTLQALATGNRTAALSGTVSADGNRVTGTFLATEPGRPADSGTFELSRN